MAKRPNRVRQVNRDEASVYLKKATEFFGSMQQAMQAERWNAAGLNAVHCAISSCDAVLVRRIGQRSASSDHDAAADLLSTLATLPDIEQKTQTLRRILKEKNLIEYEEREITHHNAAELAKLTERFYRWAHGLVG